MSVRFTYCQGKTCGARIAFLKTKAGRSIPVDADSVGRNDEVFELGKHVPHHSTCPNVSDFRKPKI
jgi:hypothetical protein